jgi:hypothetical protein
MHAHAKSARWSYRRMTNSTFHAGSKLAWIEQVASNRPTSPSDRPTSAFEVRVVIGISRRLDGSGTALVSQENIANFIGATERGVRKAIKSLVARGHLQIEGTARGRGKAETYRPIIKRRNGGSGFPGSQGTETRNGHSGNSEAQKAEQRSTKGGTVVPPLPSKNPIENPGACARACETDNVTSIRWRAVKIRLVECFGMDVVQSWFEKLAVDESKSGEVTLSAPTRFLKSWIEEHYRHALLEAWQAEDSAIQIVRLTVRTITRTKQQPSKQLEGDAPTLWPRGCGPDRDAAS